MATTIEQVYRAFLRPYQREFVEDWSRRIIVNKSRRIGMSAAAILKALLICLSTSYHDVYLCSTSFVNAKELLRRIRKWASIFERSGYRLPVAENKKTELVFSNGSRILPMPALKVRSREGTVILDEFAFYQWDAEVWQGVQAVALTDPSMQIIIISTPYGESGTFWKIWNDPDDEYGEWSRHRIDIHDAVAQGFEPAETPEQIRENNPRDVWLQEYCCEFLSGDDQYFPYDLIRRSQYSPVDILEEGEDYGDGDWKLVRERLYGDAPGELYGGVDWASERDASVLTPMLLNGPQEEGPRRVLPMHYLKDPGESKDYSEQYAQARKLLEQRRFEAVWSDGTGEGKASTQDLIAEFGRAVHLVDSQGWKELQERIPDIKRDMQDGKLKIPHDRRVRAAWSAIQRNITTNRKHSYKAARNKFGHADEFYATLLAYGASRQRVYDEPRRQVGSLSRNKFDPSGW